MNGPADPLYYAYLNPEDRKHAV